VNGVVISATNTRYCDEKRGSKTVVKSFELRNGNYGTPGSELLHE